ncbi:MAG: response regulator [Bacteroidota bacterium]|nr:response regulator [Bacteroidota bacterium]
MTQNNINILIVEDELLIGENISDILFNEGYVNVQIACSVDEAILFIEKQKPDLVFSDIALGSGKSGIELGKLLNEKYHIPFIYITSHFSSQIVQQAKQTSPKAYLTKPFKKQDLLIALELGLFKQQTNTINDTKDVLIVKDGHDRIRIPLDEIIWIKAEKNYTEIHQVSSKVIVVRELFTEILARLPEYNFARVHKSFGVNLKFITEVKSTKILLKTVEIPIGRIYSTSLKNRLKY